MTIHRLATSDCTTACCFAFFFSPVRVLHAATLLVAYLSQQGAAAEKLLQRAILAMYTFRIFISFSFGYFLPCAPSMTKFINVDVIDDVKKLSTTVHGRNFLKTNYLHSHAMHYG